MVLGVETVIVNGVKGTESRRGPVDPSRSTAERKLRALVVDDDIVTRLVNQRIVKRLGFDVEVAENGQKAVDLHRGEASFDLILMDRDMLVKNGVQATRELRAMGVLSMIVGVTGRGEGPELQDFVESGLDACFSKPLKAAALTNVIAAKETKINARN